MIETLDTCLENVDLSIDKIKVILNMFLYNTVQNSNEEKKDNIFTLSNEVARVGEYAQNFKDIPKPQKKFEFPIDNSHLPFVPILKEKQFAIKPIED